MGRGGRIPLALALAVACAAIEPVAPRAIAHNGESGSGSAPTVPPTLGPPKAGPQDPEQGQPAGPRPTTGGSGDAWRRWWEIQSPLLVPPRVRVTTDDPLAAHRPAAEKIRTLDDAALGEAIPALLWAIDPHRDFGTPTVCRAYRALGRLARRPDHVEPLLAAAARRDTAKDETENALGSLGLLRRSDPARRLDDATLARVRRTLLLALDDAGLPTRTRCVAALALGMLADQGGPAPDALARDLASRLGSGYAADDLPSAILDALGRFPASLLGDDVLLAMRTLGVSGVAGRARLGATARAHAVLAWGRACEVPSAATLLSILLARRLPDGARLGALAALGVRAATFPPATRVDAVRRIRALIDAEPSQSAYRPAGLLAIARLVSADLADGSGLVLESSGADDFFVDGLTTADLGMRPFAMLALGIAGRRSAKGSEVRGYHAFRAKALKALRELARTEAGAADARGAFLVGLGLFGDEASIPMLIERTRDTSGAEAPRSYACEALGLVGRAAPEVMETLRRVGAEPRGDGWTRGKAVAALSRLGGGADVVGAIAAELAQGGASWRMAPLAEALGRSDRVEAVEPLVRAIRAPATKDEVRAAACEALGRLCDPEPVPSLAALAEGAIEIPAADGLWIMLSWL